MNPESKRAELIYLLVTAAYGTMRYTKDHQIVRSLVTTATGIVNEFLEKGNLVLSLTDKGLFWNEAPISGRASYINAFSNAMRRKGIIKISFSKELSIEECRSFAAHFLTKDPVAPGKGIQFTVIEKEQKQAAKAPSEVVKDSIHRLLDIYRGIIDSGKIDTNGIESIISGLIESLVSSNNVLRTLSPYTTHDEYVAVHSVNVTLLSLIQASGLGISEENMKEIGIAALLHNVGKLFSRSSTSEIQRTVTPEDWEIISRHPIDGAIYLSKIHDIPPLAPIVAFEHHMKYNGSGYPDTNRIGKNQHIASQMVAISDFFEVLRMDRPYHKPVDQAIITGLIHELSGTDFNPLLAVNFIQLVQKDPKP